MKKVFFYFIFWIALTTFFSCNSSDRNKKKYPELEQSYIDSSNKKLEQDIELSDRKSKIMIEGLKQGKSQKQAKAYADSIVGDGSHEFNDARLKADMIEHGKHKSK